MSMTIDKMFSRIFRTTIQSSIVRSCLCNGPILTRSIGEKLQDTKLPNFINHWTSQNKRIHIASSTVPLYISNTNSCATLFSPPTTTSILNTKKLNVGSDVPIRSAIKYSRTRGKPRNVRAVTKRFFRLNWGIWIRTKAGRFNKIWRSRSSRRNRMRQHVFCNAGQSWLLDKMVSSYYKKPKYYVDDPYEPYHTREEFWITRQKPQD